MEEKKTAEVTVTIECSDGYKKTVSGDTAIVWTLSNVIAFLEGDVEGMDGDAMYLGTSIPDIIFPEVIAEYISSFVKNEYGKDNPMKAGYFLYAISNELKKESRRMTDGKTAEEIKKFSRAYTDEILDTLLGRDE